MEQISEEARTLISEHDDRSFEERYGDERMQEINMESSSEEKELSYGITDSDHELVAEFKNEIMRNKVFDNFFDFAKGDMKVEVEWRSCEGEE